MKMRYLFLMIVTLLFAASSFAQNVTTTGNSSTVPVTQHGRVPAGKTITDSKGREVHNGGLNQNGSVKIRYSGKIKTKPNGDLECTGEITEVTNPASQGSDGPVNINTNGQDTTINIDRNGTDPGGHIATYIDGGNADVNVTGNFNDVFVGGGNNDVTISGNNNTGSGGGVGSGGVVHQGGRGNTWNSNGGNWRIRN